MKQTPDISTPDKVKPNTPQKYGHARRVVPIRRRIWQKVALRWLIMLAIGVAILLLTDITYRNGLLIYIIISGKREIRVVIRSSLESPATSIESGDRLSHTISH